LKILLQSLRKNKVVKNAGWIIGGKVANKLLAFVVGIFAARYLGPSNYGLINYAAAYATFFASLCTLGINSVIVKNFVDHPDQQGETIGTTLLLRAMSSLLSVIMKQDDMRHTYQELYPQYAEKIKFYIGDVRDYNSILNAFRGVDYVFHAAALKQVPSCEFYPMEAVKTNVAGSDNVISACVANHVKKAIFLSTDKAAYPINAMGMTKAVMEKNVIARSRQMLPGDPVLCLTRYGNVMASRGSVIPLFCDRIDEGKPLTITNPNMTRFMMTLSRLDIARSNSVVPIVSPC
jgi:hypothetical protein